MFSVNLNCIGFISASSFVHEFLQFCHLTKVICSLCRVECFRKCSVIHGLVDFFLQFSFLVYNFNYKLVVIIMFQRYLNAVYISKTEFNKLSHDLISRKIVLKIGLSILDFVL